MSSWCVFDIETEPLPDDELKKIVPPWEPEPFNDGKPFDPASVKTGNLKDESKIIAKIQAAEQQFELDKARHEKKQKSDQAEHFDKFKSSAAMDAATGRVLAIGFYALNSNKFTLVAEDKEIETLREFWRIYQDAAKSKIRLAGVNIFAFDLPFLVRRSWILGAHVPNGVVELTTRWCNWSSVFVDLRNVWQLGDRQAKSSFAHISAALGVGGKFADMDGKDFAVAWRKNRDQAIKYLKQDVAGPAEWIRRFGLAPAWEEKPSSWETI